MLIIWLLVSPLRAAATSTDLLISVRPIPTGAEVTLKATKPFEFVTQQLENPFRIVVDLFGIDGAEPGTTQKVNLYPVTAIRRARGRGFFQVVIYVEEPVRVQTQPTSNRRILRLLTIPYTKNSPASTQSLTPPPPRVEPQVIRLQHVPAGDVASHLRALFPHLTVRVYSAVTIVLIGEPELVNRARQLAAALDVPPPEAILTEVVPLKAARATTLAGLLGTIFPSAKIRAEEERNALVIIAPRRLIEQIRPIISTLDVPALPSPTDPVTEVLRIQHGDPMKIASLLGSVLQGAKLQVDPGTRTITLTATPATIGQAKSLLQQMDTPSRTDPVTEVVRVRTTDVEAAATLVRQAVPTITVTVDRALGALLLDGPRGEVERAKTMLSTLDVQQGPPGRTQLRVEVIPLKYAMPSEFITDPSTSRSAEELAQAVSNALQPVYPELRVTVERRSQALIVTGTPDAIVAVRNLVMKLDVLPPQVALEVRVIEVAANALKNLGISLAPIIGTTFTEQDPNTRLFTFGRTPINITLILNLLSEQGQAKILANPTVATIDGRRALIRTGDDIPLIVRQIFGNTVLETLVTLRAGITLEITPKISSEGIITCMLRPVVSTITGFTLQGTPQISVREVQTTLAAGNGETIVIGGLLEERDVRVISKIPGLGDLPFFGRLFRSEREEQRRTELVITVTPRLLVRPGNSPEVPP